MNTNTDINATLERIIKLEPSAFASKVAATILDKGYFSVKQARIINEFMLDNSSDFDVLDTLPTSDQTFDDQMREAAYRQLPSSMR